MSVVKDKLECPELAAERRLTIADTGIRNKLIISSLQTLFDPP
jgi:hypothetical protein